jgi:UDP-N-acetylglucosamine 2-epimerase
MKVMSIVGTRPELIKMSEIIKKLDDYTDHVFVHTGQNYDYELNEIFYDDLELRRPDEYLGVGGGSLAETVSNVLVNAEVVIKKHQPDAVVILGDTNSALAGIIVKRMKIPLFHLEAGNRCFDDNVPEEINRRILDHISDVNMVYTQSQRLYLRDEGIAKDRLFVMGSPMKEILAKHRSKIMQGKILTKLKLKPQEYFLVSIHRDENTEIEVNLEVLLDTLESIAAKYKMPIVVSTHPRFEAKLGGRTTASKDIKFLKPFSFNDYILLQGNAKCVISDSGTIAEESAILGFPAITIRNAIERPEAIDVGSVLMTGVDKDNILTCLDVVSKPTTVPPDYDVDNCSERVLKVILGYTPYVNRYVWHK